MTNETTIYRGSRSGGTYREIPGNVPPSSQTRPRPLADARAVRRPVPVEQLRPLEGSLAGPRARVPGVTTGMGLGFADGVWALFAPEDWAWAEKRAKEDTETLAELNEPFLTEAARYSTLSMQDWEAEGKLNAESSGLPDALVGRTSLYSGLTPRRETSIPSIGSFTVVAEVSVPQGGATGCIISKGGRLGTWRLYFELGVLAFEYRRFSYERYGIRGDRATAPGNHTLELELAYDGDRAGKGATVTLSVDGTKVGEGRIRKTAASGHTDDNFVDIGKDLGARVHDCDTPRGEFTGAIAWVRVE